jgi:putative ABC transport system substrate-binding protein
LSERREFITLLGGAAATWPLMAGAQHAERVRRIGMLMSAVETDTDYQDLLSTFREELKKLGWQDGRNIHIEYRWKAVDEKSRQRLQMSSSCCSLI